MTLHSFMRGTFEDLLARFAEVCVAFVRHPRLEVPEGVIQGEGVAMVLSYGLNMPVPILDLEVTDEGVSATLSFSLTPHATFVPWEAVVGIRGYGELLGDPTYVPREKTPGESGPAPRPKFLLVP